MNENEVEAQLPYRCEYAKSNRSKCKTCKLTIEKGEFRLAKMVRSSQFDGLVPYWYHVACFFKHPKKHGLTDVAQVEALPFAKPEDQDRVRNLVSPNSSSSIQPAADAKPDCAETPSKVVWKVVEALAAFVKPVLNAWLDDAQLEPAKSDDEARQKLARAVVYGIPPPCPDCSASLHRVAAGYKCGARNEWGTCLYAAPTAVCKPLDVRAADLKSALPAHALAYLQTPAPWVGVAAASSAHPQQLPGDGDEEGDEDGAKIVRWEKICLYCGDEDLRNRLALVGVRLVKTRSAKTVDALVLSARERLSGEKPKLSAEKLATDALVEEAFSDESKFVQLAIDPQTDDPKKLAELWKRAHGAEVDKSKKRSAPDSDGSSSITQKKVKLVIKGRCAVDPLAGSEYVEHWRVHDPDPTKTIPFDAVLNLADVATGTNSYYGLQVLECENKNESQPWALFRKWGRIGSDRGGQKVERFGSLGSAVAEFESLFDDKTGNAWSDHAAGKFAKKPGKFAPVRVALHEETSEKDTTAAGRSVVVDHGLDARVATLMSKIFDVKAIEASLREMEIDLNKMPLGNLTKATVDQGYAVLQEIETLVQGGIATTGHDGTIETAIQQLSVAVDAQCDGNDATEPKRLIAQLFEWVKERRLAKERRKRSQLIALSNKFYTFIPHDFGDAAPTVISSLEQVRAKTELLDVLAEVEAAVSILKSPSGGSAVHPIRARYDELHSCLVPIERNDPRHELVETLLKNQAGNGYRVSLKQTYQVEREGENERFLDLPGKRALLWHGSRLTNWGGILSRGLLIAPPSAPVSGYRLGKGVYFANVAEKSIGYAAPRSGQTILLLLCEVALGKPAELLRDQYMEKPIAGFDSTHALGTLTPSSTVSGKSALGVDVDVPIGKPSHRAVSSSFLHDEFVVYDVRQVRQRILVELDVL